MAWGLALQGSYAYVRLEYIKTIRVYYFPRFPGIWGLGWLKGFMS